MNKKFGFVSLTGRTNVGKSTLLNSLFGKKIAITSRKPQTTRNRILGIFSENNNQIVFLDTPGVHSGFKRALNKYMNRVARNCYEEVDLVIFVVDRGRWQKEEENILKNLKELNKPIFLVINKIDRPGARPNWAMDQVFELFDTLGASDEQLDFAVVFTSAINGVAGLDCDKISNNMEPLFETIINQVPAPNVDLNGPFQMQISALDYDTYTGVEGLGKIFRGSISVSYTHLTLPTKRIV